MVQQNLELKVFYDEATGDWIAKSEAYDRVVGVGDTKKEAEKIFYELLEDWLELETKNIVIPKGSRGRPKKNNSKLTVNIDYRARAFLGLMAKDNNVNIGKALEEVVEFYAKAHPEKDFGVYKEA